MPEREVAGATDRSAPIVADGTDRSAPIVAELGRPETPQETADRKAAQSRLHRANQTVRNLVWSLVATLIVVLLLVLVVVRPDPAPIDPVDYREVASQTVAPDGETLIVPNLPEGWTANAAALRTVDQVETWYIGFITPLGRFIGFEQGFDANDTWLAEHFAEESSAPKSIDVDGREWTEVLGVEDPGNFARVWASELEDDERVVLYGTAEVEEFTILATSLGVDSNGRH